MPPPIASKEFTLLMALLMSIVAISIDALLPSLGVIGTELGVARANDTQLVIACLFGGMAVGQLIAGPLSDALGRKPVLNGGIALYLVGSLICYHAVDFHVLLAERVLQGLGVAGPYVTAVSVVRDRYEGRAMARAMSFIMMIFILVPAIAPSFGQIMLHHFGWRSLFLVYIGYAVTVGIWIALRLEETLPPAQRLPFTRAAFARGVRTVIANRTTMLYTLCMGLCFGSLIGYLNASQQIFQNQFGVGDAFALYFGGLALLIGAASLVNARLVQRLGMRRMCLGATASIVIASFIFLLLQELVAPIILPMFVGYAAILLFCFGLMFGNLNAIAMEPMGAIAGLASAITGAASSVVSLALGTLIGQLYNGTLLPMTVGFLVFGALSWTLMRIERRYTAPDAPGPLG